MLCQSCGQRDATVKVVSRVNGAQTVEYICDVCARAQNKLPDGNNTLSFSQLLAGLFNSDGLGLSSINEKQADMYCSQCGMTWSRFRTGSRLGCAACYEEFRPQLLPLIRRLHGHVEHRGHIPQNLKATLGLQKKLKALRLELQEAIIDERYEEAAKFRDEIKSLENDEQVGETHE